MKKVRKVLAGLLTIPFLLLPAGSSSAAAGSTASQAASSVVEKQKAYFKSFQGEVKEVQSCSGNDCPQTVLVEDKEGRQVNFIVSNDTYRLNDAEIKKGTTITGFYDANVPVIMIYPPQYNAEVIVAGAGKHNIKVDLFDDSLVSGDNLLKLNISDDTKIVLEDGTAFKGELGNQRLVVLYGRSTKSIPAQTTPVEIIVLFEQAERPGV
ncbi:hypothetical protein HSX37_08160|uniref:Uncharacterized protein n=1 Tax=Dendrosporobacter quercicolus TaxID=146817 RepID=A0A1G9UW44_9FIRM|nr:hypothetical protein [Dendrosporobacter quercicolus]NSL48015.1 hypothetical protein [Dendrosporobacter quercicolus DSM 1736]SDM63835.1 hypothetical protein SAMN04488502_10677 [Dendrosporobacter quercicolus]